MHRGSSKGARRRPSAPEALPLSASPTRLHVVVEVTRGGSVERRELELVPGTLVRAVLRSIGQAPEGSAVLVDDLPIPLDTAIDRALTMTVVPTFSGG
jgi:sulfur carrier protein ThiS